MIRLFHFVEFTIEEKVPLAIYMFHCFAHLIQPQPQKETKPNKEKLLVEPKTFILTAWIKNFWKFEYPVVQGKEPWQKR